MKDLQISRLESEWNRHKQADSMWIFRNNWGEEVKNKISEQHNWIQPRFKTHKHSPNDYIYVQQNRKSGISVHPVYITNKEINKHHIKKDMTSMELRIWPLTFNKSQHKKSWNMAHNNKVNHRQQKKEYCKTVKAMLSEKKRAYIQCNLSVVKWYKLKTNKKHNTLPIPQPKTCTIEFS